MLIVCVEQALSSRTQAGDRPCLVSDQVIQCLVGPQMFRAYTGNHTVIRAYQGGSLFTEAL